MTRTQALRMAAANKKRKEAAVHWMSFMENGWIVDVCVKGPRRTTVHAPALERDSKVSLPA